MARPIYETLDSQQNEETIIKEFCAYHKCEYAKLPRSYILDYALIKNNEIVGFAEVKRRKVAMGMYPTIFVALHKTIAANNMPLPCALVVGWDDAYGWLDLKSRPVKLAMSGRKDRNDPADIEPMVYFPMNRVKTFHKISDEQSGI